jgi:hypothetical protein
MAEVKYANNPLVGKPLEDLDVGRMLILKWILK